MVGLPKLIIYQKTDSKSQFISQSVKRLMIGLRITRIKSQRLMKVSKLKKRYTSGGTQRTQVLDRLNKQSSLDLPETYMLI